MSVDRILKGHDLFRSLNVDETHRIGSFSSVKTCGADETIFKLDDPAAHVYMLLDGAVDLLLPANPPEFNFVISRIKKGELFGLSPLLDSKHYTATAQCREKTELLSIEAKPFMELLRSNCPVGYYIMSQVAQIYFTRYIKAMQNVQAVVKQISMIH